MAETFQVYEAFLAGLLLLSLFPVLLQYWRYRCRWFLSAYLCFTAGAIASVLEAFVFAQLFNLMEHVMFLAAGGFFWLTAERSAETVLDQDVQDVIDEVVTPG